MFQNRARAPNFEASGANSLFSAQAFLDCNKVLACYHESWSTIGKKLNKMDVYMCDQNCEKLKKRIIYIYICIYIFKKGQDLGEISHSSVVQRNAVQPFCC